MGDSTDDVKMCGEGHTCGVTCTARGNDAAAPMDVTMQLSKDAGGQQHSGVAEAYAEGDDGAVEYMVLDDYLQQQCEVRAMLSFRPGLPDAVGAPGDLKGNGGAVAAGRGDDARHVGTLCPRTDDLS